MSVKPYAKICFTIEIRPFAELRPFAERVVASVMDNGRPMTGSLILHAMPPLRLARLGIIGSGTVAANPTTSLSTAYAVAREVINRIGPQSI